MTINVAIVKLLEDKFSDLVLCHQPDVESEKVILLEWVLVLLQTQYNEGFKEGYEQREAEYGSEQCDNDQASWERGYQDGIMDSSL